MPAVDAPIRNVDFDAAAPVGEWSPEVIEIVLDRGSLSDWRLIADEIKRQPWGHVARTVEQIVTWREHYGVDDIMAAVVERARAAVDATARRRYAAHIRALRHGAGLTLAEAAALVGTSVPTLSAYENGRVAPSTIVLGRIEAMLNEATRPPNTRP